MQNDKGSARAQISRAKFLSPSSGTASNFAKHWHTSNEATGSDILCPSRSVFRSQRLLAAASLRKPIFAKTHEPAFKREDKKKKTKKVLKYSFQIATDRGYVCRHGNVTTDTNLKSQRKAPGGDRISHQCVWTTTAAQAQSGLGARHFQLPNERLCRNQNHFETGSAGTALNTTLLWSHFISLQWNI